MTLKEILYDWVIPCLIVPAIPLISGFIINWLRVHTKIAISESDKKTLDAAAQRALVWGANRVKEGATASDIALNAAAYLKTTIPDVIKRAGSSDTALKISMEARALTPQVVAPAGSAAVPVAPTPPEPGLPSDSFGGAQR
jgi:hypothetical protein